MRKDNRGLSLVEIIIVITILSIVAGVITTGVSLATGRPADECASKLQSVIQSSRLTAMSKLDVTLEIYMNAEGYIYVEETVTSEGDDPEHPVVRTTLTRIGERDITFEFTLTNGTITTTTTLQQNHANSLILTFDRSSGAFKPVYSDMYCKTITISRGNREKKLQLAYLTGKVTLE